MRVSLCLIVAAAQLAACATSTNKRALQQTGAATPNGKFIAAVVGDWGSSTPAQKAVADQICAARGRLGFKDVITTGDNFYDPDGTATESNYNNPERCVISYRGHRWHATWGNHDDGPSTGTVLGAKKYYQWSFGNIDFFMLDSNEPANRTQIDWLDTALKESDARLKVAVFHHPPFTTGSEHSSDEDVQNNWVPLFERHKVALVLNGHNHLYEHSVVRGIDYVVTGGGGRKLYDCARQEPWLQKCVSKYHFVLLEIDSQAFSITAIDEGGQELDRFSKQY